MTQTHRKYHAAAVLLFVSAALHIPILALAYSAFGTAMIVAIILWTAFGFGLIQQYRWVAYLAFVGMLIGISAALGSAMATDGIVSALFWAISIVDFVAAIVLFGLLWRQASTST